jgi:CIC family chloride channel protein
MSTATGKWALIGTLIGIVAGIGAIILYLAISFVTTYLLTGLTGYNPPRSGLVAGLTLYKISPNIHYLFIPVSLVVGGFLVALILNKTAPEAKGHGTDAAISAFHKDGGRIRKRIPTVKTIASAITIGSGGSAGREGPTAQIAAGFGSFISDIFHLDDHDRRIAVASGIGAGIGSIFLAPLGGAILSTEILYKRDFETEALIPSTIASVVGYSIFGYFTGYKTIFMIPTTTVIGFFHPLSLIAYLIIGLLAGGAAIFYIKTFYGITYLFSKAKRISPYAKPAIGGAVVGLIAIFFPEILGLGYGWVQQILDGNLSLFGTSYLSLFLIFIALFLLKTIATAFTIGSEGSGGVFAPGLVIGAFLGAAIAIPLLVVFPFLSFDEIVIVAMISLFGGASKAPIAIIIMGTEMTGSYALFIPLMLATTVSYFVTGDLSIYKSQVLDRSQSPAHEEEYKKPIMDEIPVYTAMKKDYLKVSKNDSLRTGINKLRESRTKGILVEDNDILEGYLSIENIPSDANYDLKIEDFMETNIPKISNTDNLHNAMNILIKEPSGKLVVVSDNDKNKAVGTLTLSEVADAYNREIRRIKELQRHVS